MHYLRPGRLTALLSAKQSVAMVSTWYSCGRSEHAKKWEELNKKQNEKYCAIGDSHVEITRCGTEHRVRSGPRVNQSGAGRNCGLTVHDASILCSEMHTAVTLSTGDQPSPRIFAQIYSQRYQGSARCK